MNINLDPDKTGDSEDICKPEQNENLEDENQNNVLSHVDDAEKCVENFQADSSDPEQTNSERSEKLLVEREKLVGQLLRLKADFDNYKRRSKNQAEEIRVFANQGLVEELLPVIDNFQRAINSAPADSSYMAGVKMIFSQLMECLARQGLEIIHALGEPFDPNFHEAVSMEGDSTDELVVIAEIQKGYLFKNKLLRASMVQVAPKQQLEEEA